MNNDKANSQVLQLTQDSIEMITYSLPKKFAMQASNINLQVTLRIHILFILIDLLFLISWL